MNLTLIQTQIYYTNTSDSAILKVLKSLLLILSKSALLYVNRVIGSVISNVYLKAIYIYTRLESNGFLRL